MFRSPRFLHGFALSVLLAVSAGVSAQAVAKETVALSFGWPSGLQGQVAFNARTTQTMDGRSETINMAGRYDFATSEAADGLLIRFDNAETEVENSGSGPQAMIKKFMAKAASTPPAYVVDPSGEFIRIEGLDGFRRAMIEGMEDAFADFPAQTRQQVIQAISAIFTKEQLEASIVSEWNTYVGAWINAELDEGAVYEITYNEPVPAFGNMAVPMRAQFAFKQRVACHNMDLADRCVELEMRSFVDSERFAAALEAFLQRLPAGQNMPKVESLKQETTVRLISEPDTLLPHLMESSKRTLATVSVGEESKVSSRVEEKQFVYSY